ncbi:MAG: hypothetical protein GY811_19920 [Myxococcales bacterium]|nr:hypothetical protein [Myxococcales bacterium]
MSQAIAAEMGDGALASEIAAVQQRTKGNLSRAPAASRRGKKARKSNREDAYKLMY